MNISDLAAIADRLSVEYKAALQSRDSMQANLDEATEHMAAELEAQDLVQRAAQSTQEQAHARISLVVTKCLAAVFTDPYTFHIYFDRKRGKTEARMVFMRDGHEIDPLEASGGGVVDVASFALRISSIMLSLPRSRRLLVMDEPFRFVSVNLRDRVRDMLEVLAEEFQFQFILVTHMDELTCGEVVRL